MGEGRESSRRALTLSAAAGDDLSHLNSPDNVLLEVGDGAHGQLSFANALALLSLLAFDRCLGEVAERLNLSPVDRAGGRGKRHR